jgi:Polysulphide reductase, NrfD
MKTVVPPAKPQSYYGRAVIKEPVWTPEIPIYFFTGGMAGASAGLAFVARLTGRRKLARVATGNAFAGVAVSPVLLISDLGKPARFLNMLRVFKVTSPMSVGSWLISVEGGLLALTVPVWHEGRKELPFAFAGGSAMAAGAAAAMLAPSESSPARRLAIIGAMTEAISMEVSKKSMGKVSEPYATGPAGKLQRATMACAGGGAALLVYAEARRSRHAGLAGSALTLAGSMLGRWMVFRAGFQSAAAPQYTVAPQRERRNLKQAQP